MASQKPSPGKHLFSTFLTGLLFSGLTFATRTPGGEDSIARGVKFQNNHALAMHISNDWSSDDMKIYPDLAWIDEVVPAGGSIYLPAPYLTSPKYYVGPTANNRSAAVGDRRNHHTVVEATYGDTEPGYEATTWWDIDIEKGFSVPIWCVGAEDHERNGYGCLADVLAACPQEDRHIDNETGIYDYCIGKDTEENLGMRKALCPDIYVVHNDLRTNSIANGSVLSCTISNPDASKAGPQNARYRALGEKQAN